MKLGLLDPDGTLLSVAHRVQQEGHDLRHCVLTQNARTARVGAGLVPQVTSLASLLAWRPDVIVAYGVPQHVPAIRELGIPVWGTSPASNRLETERAEAVAWAATRDIPIPETHRFLEPPAALRWLESRPETRWVYKLEGVADSDTTHLPPTRAGLHACIAFEAERHPGRSFILQAFLPGVEVGCEGWFDYRHDPPWLWPILGNVEWKRLMPGESGPLTGGMGSCVWPWGARPRLFRELLEPLTGDLTRMEYLGPLDVSAIIPPTDDVARLLEFSPRLSWDTFEATMSAYAGDLGGFLVALGRGHARTLAFVEPFALAVKAYARQAGAPIGARLESPYLLPKQMRRDEAGILRAAGEADETGFIPIAEAAAPGETPEGCRRRAYGALETLGTPDLLYRSDIGLGVAETLAELRRVGYDG